MLSYIMIGGTGIQGTFILMCLGNKNSKTQRCMTIFQIRPDLIKAPRKAVCSCLLRGQVTVFHRGFTNTDLQFFCNLSDPVSNKGYTSKINYNSNANANETTVV